MDAEKEAKAKELAAFIDLFPTANLTQEPRDLLEKFLPNWFEMLNKYKGIPFGYPAIQKALLKAVLDIDIYNGLSDEFLSTPPGEGQDTPAKEWWHQIRNNIMRTNALRSHDIFDFGEDKESLKDLESFNGLSKETRSIIHLKAINSLFTEITKTDENGRLVHKFRDQITWFGKSVPFDEMVISALIHETDHSKIYHIDYIKMYGGLPPIQTKLNDAPLQTRQKLL